ncbi:MAG: FecR domain-containing protein [Lachnospiraceae bacterium]|nr:FecR domain-containing protein [Lachnospiraceae bacterium]
MMIIVAALLLVAAIIIFFIWRSKITATTMRILRLEGEVTLEDNGSPKQVKENLRLKSGNALTTAGESLVSIGLDDTKIVTLNEKSRAEFNQSGRKLDLELTAGSLFFEVSAPLTDEETFDIRTSTMVVGIRGTSGLVSVEGGHESLIISDGTVHVIGTNPFTKEVKEIDVSAGQKITVYLYNDRDVDSIEFFLEEVTEHEMPEFALQRMRENEELLDKVVKETGWDRDWILGIKKDVPSDDDNGPDDGDDGPGGGSAQPEIAEPTEEPVETGDTGDGTDSDETERETTVKGPTPESLERAKNAIISEDPGSGLVALNVGTLFDPEWYANAYPDVARAYGKDTVALVAHYLDYGRKEGRLPLPPRVAKATPTPTFDPNANNSGGSDEEEEEPEPSPTGGGGGGGGATATSSSYDSSKGNTVPLPGGSGTFVSASNTLMIPGGQTVSFDIPYTITDTHTGTSYTVDAGDLALEPGSVSNITETIGSTRLTGTYTDTGNTFSIGDGNTYDDRDSAFPHNGVNYIQLRDTSSTPVIEAYIAPNGTVYYDQSLLP